jgi:hypothetical protein
VALLDGLKSIFGVRMPPVFLDMDGVLADVAGGWCSRFGIERGTLFGPTYPPGLWEFWRRAGWHDSYFHAWLNLAPEEFWSGLGAFAGAHWLYSKLSEVADVYFLSAPPERTPLNAIAGKWRWLLDWGGAEAAGRLIPTRHKAACAGPGKVLVDDKPANVLAFREAGGLAVLYPRVWNDRHAEADREALDVLVLDEVLALL